MANIIDIVVGKQAQAEVDKLIASLKLTHEEIIKINQQGLKINSGASPKNPVQMNQSVKETIALTKELTEAEQKLLTNTKKVLDVQGKQIQNQIKQNNLDKSNIATSKAKNAEVDRTIKANEKLNSAYQQLSQKEAESARRVQDLIARGKTATQTQRQYNEELRRSQREFTTYRTKVLQADQAVGRWNRTGERSIGFMRNLAGAFGIVGGVTLFASITREVFQTTKELQSLDNALKQVSGTQEQMAHSQSFLRDISESYGLEINGLTKQFTQFYVSAKDKLSATQIENIFRSISKAGATMGLSVDAQERAFLALNQMMSKGVVSAEELRGQLGEALPGAFGIMAKAVGVTEVELGKLMKDGKLMADEVLPKFARELEKVYGIETITRVETLTASQNRLSNSWTELVRSLNESETGGISQFFKFIVDGLNTIANLLVRVNTSWGDLWQQAGKKGAATGKKFFEDNIRLNSSDIELKPEERASINKRIADIKQMFKYGYNDPSLQKELNELFRKLNPSEGQAEGLGNTASKNIELYTSKIQKLNEELKKSDASSYVGGVLKRMVGVGERHTKTISIDLEKANFDLAYWKQVKTLADNYGNVIEEVDTKTKSYNTTKKERVAIQKEEEILGYYLFGLVVVFLKLLLILHNNQ